MVGDQALEEGPGAETVAFEVVFGEDDGVGEVFVFGQGSDKGQDLRDVGAGRLPDDGTLPLILNCDTGHKREEVIPLPYG